MPYGPHPKSKPALTVQAHILGEGCADNRLQAQLVGKVSDRVRVLVIAARGDSQVCRVEKWQDLSLPDDIGHLPPLLLAWVAAAGIVRAGMEHEHGLRRRL